MTLAESHRPRGPMRVVRTVHRWAGLLLFVWVSLGTLLTLPSVYEQTGATGIPGVVEVFRLEAEGGGAVNLPATLVLICIVAGLVLTVLIDLLRRGRSPFSGRARRSDGSTCCTGGRVPSSRFLS